MPTIRRALSSSSRTLRLLVPFWATLDDADDLAIFLRPKSRRRPSVRISGEGSTVFYHGDTIAEALVGVLQGEAASVKAKRDNDTKKEESL